MSRNEEFHTGRGAERYHDGPYVYDVTRALEMIGDRKPTTTVNVEDGRRAIEYGRSVDLDHAKTVDVSRPVLIAHHSPESKRRKLLIDGWHRVQHASDKGMKELPAVELTPEETSQIMYTERGFKEKGVMTHAQYQRKNRQVRE